MGIGIGQRIEAPARGAVRRGLVVAAPSLVFPVVDGDDGGTVDGQERWIGGVMYEAGACDALDPRPILCADLGDKPDQTSDGNPSWDPYYVMGADRCTTMDRGRPRVENARRNLLATQSEQIESEVWDGVASRAATPDLDNPYLAKVGDGDVPLADILSTTAVPFVQALAWLDHALVACLHGGQGMIHATAFTANLWQAAGLLNVGDGGRLLTVSENIVVIGAGYSGSAPGATEGSAPIPPADISVAAYAYATGLVYVGLGREDRIARTESQEIDRTTNDQTTRVERPAVAVWGPCCQIGINIDHAESGA